MQSILPCCQAHGSCPMCNSVLYSLPSGKLYAVSEHTSLSGPALLQTAEASDKLRDIIAPLAGGLSSAFTPLKGMVSQNCWLWSMSCTSCLGQAVCLDKHDVTCDFSALRRGLHGYVGVCHRYA